MLELLQGEKYKKAFFDKHPNAFCVESLEPIHNWYDMKKQIEWAKENILYDAFLTFKPVPQGTTPLFLLWYLTNEIDIMAAKLRWI